MHKNAVSCSGVLKSQWKEVKREAYIVIMIITGQVSCAVKFGISASFKLSLGGRFYPKHDVSLSLKVAPLFMEMQWAVYWMECNVAFYLSQATKISAYHAKEAFKDDL